MTVQAYPGDFPDPFVLPPTAPGGTYWAFATGTAGRNLQAMSSTDVTRWTGDDLCDPLPRLPAWADAGHTWSPAVVRRSQRYVLYYTVRERASGRQCISVATAGEPAGPYVDRSRAPLLHQRERGGSIDPDPFVTPDGRVYLLWKSEENALGRATNLWSQRLSDDGLRLVESPNLLLTMPAGWQAPVLEGPSMIVDAGSYYLFYGANDWDSRHAAIGYARGAGPAAPYTDACPRRPWLAGARLPFGSRTARGPAGPALFREPDGTVRMAYHAWTGGVRYSRGAVRSLWMGRVEFRNGVPALR